MIPRGAIHTPLRASQLRDFSGLCYGKITPSDMDAVIDFGGRAFVAIELKVEGQQLPIGQRILLERINDKHNTRETKALVLVAEHNTPVTMSIDVANCRVVAYLNETRVWTSINARITVREAINSFLKRVGLDSCYEATE